MAILFRKILIKLGKSLPFLLCFLVFISSIESLFAAITDNVIEYGGYTILNTPVSFFIGRLFEYDVLIILIALVVSLAIEACKWNLWAIFYLCVFLILKGHLDQELEYTGIYIFSSINAISSFWFSFKGIKILCHGDKSSDKGQ